MSMLDEEVRTCNVQGIALAQQGRLDEAAAWFRHALTLNPEASAAHNNLGNILSMQGNFAEAVTCYRAALKLVHKHPGITISEMAKRMKIQANYLYRVLPRLEKDGKITKRDKGYHPPGS